MTLTHPLPRTVAARAVQVSTAVRRHPILAWALALAFWIATPFPPAEWAVNLAAQTTLTNTTLAAALTNASDQSMTLAAVTSMSATTTSAQTYALIEREVVGLRAINTTTKVVQITRGLYSTRATGHPSGAKVWYVDASVAPIVLTPQDRAGACSTTGSADFSQDGRYVPVFNPASGHLFTCANSAWVPYALLLGQPVACTVTQATNRTTGVTCQGTSGAITTNNASLAAEAGADFVVTDAAVAIGDVVVASIRSGAVGATTDVTVSTVTAGSFTLRVTNNNVAAGTAETGAIIINFVVIKAQP